MPLTFANQITIFRIILVPIFVAVVLYYLPQRDYYRYIALSLFLFMALLDVLDGYIARRRKEKTYIGALLDPLADKLLLISAFIVLYIMSTLFPVVKFPIWLVVAVISRDGILLLGALIIHLVQSKLVIKPNLIGKATTFFQVLCVAGILLQWEPSTYLFWPITFLLTIISGMVYLKAGLSLLNNGGH